MKARGGLLWAAALLAENGHMNGSVMVVHFASRKALDAWLAEEPYVKQRVWQHVG